jgi:hypothetical protein
MISFSIPSKIAKLYFTENDSKKIITNQYLNHLPEKQKAAKSCL